MAIAAKKPVAKKVVSTKPAAKEVAAPAKKKVGAKVVPIAAAKKGAAVAKKAPARAKKKPVQFAAPADFKSHFLLVEVHTEKDGLIGGVVNATRYMGRFDPEADDKKKFNLAEYDQDTLRAITARLAAITFKTNAERIFAEDPAARADTKGAHRLPKAAVLHVLMRVGSRKADNSLMVSVRTVYQRVTKKSAKTGKTITRSVELLKTDPVSRMIRRAGRILPAAFKNVMMPPKRTRGSRKVEDDSEE